MKHIETSVMLETYQDWEDRFKFNIHKCWDIEGARRITRYNLVVVLFNYCLWFSIRRWYVYSEENRILDSYGTLNVMKDDIK